MRRLSTIRGIFAFLVIGLLGVFAGGCMEGGSSIPTGGTVGGGESGHDLFLLNGPADTRLPGDTVHADDAEIDESPYAVDDGAGSTGNGRGRHRRSGRTIHASVTWNELTTELCLAAALPPPKVSRAYALVHTAIYDALAACLHGRRKDLVGALAASKAASTVLIYLFPGSATRIGEVLRELMQEGRGKSRGRIRRSLALGLKVGEIAVRRGRSDGSDAVFTGTIPSGPAFWSGTNPVLPMAGQWSTWICADGAEFQPEPPNPYGSAADSLELEQVYAASFVRTPEQIAIVHEWADLPPPTIWNNELNERIVAGAMSGLAAARAQAYLNCAMYDAFVSCWYTKYSYWAARPSMRLAGRVPAFTTVVPTPNFPTYTSGHSTISGAAAVVLGELFPSESAYFNAEADEAALSRFYGGIHFHRDDNQGLLVGRAIGERVVEKMRSRGGRLLP